jgi:uncharacterized protein (TIGR03083 family)
VEIAGHITAVEEEGKRFAEAAHRSGLDQDVPGCPGWDVRELVRHLSSVHLWAAAHVANRATEWRDHGPTELEEYWPDLAVFWPDDSKLIDWYLETNRNLVDELSSAPADLDCLSFLPAPSPLAMWARRQAHETAIHRFDAESPNRASTDYDRVFASDGIDELLMLFAPAFAVPMPEAKTMVAQTTDTDDTWHVTMGPEVISVVRGDGAADVTLTGSAADLYLAVWNRGTPVISLSGDPGLIATWRENYKFQWD